MYEDNFNLSDNAKQAILHFVLNKRMEKIVQRPIANPELVEMYMRTLLLFSEAAGMNPVS
jgi:hypothetical protein